MTVIAQNGRGPALPQNRGLAAAGAAAVALAGAGVAAETANATYTKGACTANRLCLWSDGGFSNNWTRRDQDLDDSTYNNNNYIETRFSHEDGLNDTVSAVWNNTNRYAMLFRNSDYGSNRICFPPGTAVRDMHTVKLTNGIIQLPGGGASWGNRVSSQQMYTSRPSDCTADGSTTVPSGQQGCSM